MPMVFSLMMGIVGAAVVVVVVVVLAVGMGRTGGKPYLLTSITANKRKKLETEHG